MGKRAKTQHELESGEMLGKYELLAPLATGGMAELYLARVKSIEGFEKVVVLKRILPNFAESEAFVQMFLNEARLSATLVHPNIAQVYDIGTFEESYFFTMEYVPGPDLRAVVRKARLLERTMPMECCIAIATGMAAGLHHAHEKKANDGKPLGLVHRDVSPSNVLLTGDGSVKIVDFGIAKAAARGGSGTATGSLKGKVAYMSPEQCRGEKTLDRRSDIFSMGIVLYELSTGTRLFKRDTQFKTINDIVWETIKPPSEVMPGYPEQLEQIVMRALNKEPDDRYQTARQMHLDIQSFARDARLMPTAMSVAGFLEDVYGEELESWQRIHVPAGGTLTATTPPPGALAPHPDPAIDAENTAPSKTSSIFAGQAAEAGTRMSRDRLVRIAKVGAAVVGLVVLFYIGLTDDSSYSFEARPAATPAASIPLADEADDVGDVEPIETDTLRAPTAATDDETATPAPKKARVKNTRADSGATDGGGDDEVAEGDEVVADGEIEADEDFIEIEPDESERIDIDPSRHDDPALAGGPSDRVRKSRRSKSRSKSKSRSGGKWDPSSPFLPPAK